MTTRGEKRLARRLMAVKGIRYTEALRELQGLGDLNWAAYVERCEAQAGAIEKLAAGEPIRVCDEQGNATPEFLASADALLRASAERKKT